MTPWKKPLQTGHFPQVVKMTTWRKSTIQKMEGAIDFG